MVVSLPFTYVGDGPYLWNAPSCHLYTCHLTACLRPLCCQHDEKNFADRPVNSSAYAEICLGIDTTIQDEDGNELHRANAGDGRRLRLRFTRLNATPTSDIHIWLRDTTASPQGPTLFGEPIHSGRVPLDVLFTKSFGRAFQHLAHSESKTFANALGGLARVWELLVADDDISPDVVSLHFDMLPSRSIRTDDYAR